MIELKRKSWHYHLATSYGKLPRCYQAPSYPPLCAYAWYVFCGIMWALMIAAFWGYIGGCVVTSAFVLMTPRGTVDLSTLSGFNAHVGIAALSLVVGAVLLAAFVVLCMWMNSTYDYWGTILRQRPRIKKQRFVVLKELYKGWKEKYCPVVKLT